LPKLRFKHLLPAEVKIWNRFLSEWGSGWDWYEYDKHLGEGIEVLEYWEDKIKQLAKVLTQFRLDVVGHKDKVVTIFEIKPQAGIGALGQVLAYRELYLKEFGSDIDMGLAIVTDRVGPDIEYIYGRFGIKLYIV